MREVDAPGCGREDDLIAFLYGELSDIEKESFETHMHTCRLCQLQTSEFRSIRGSVLAWRDESLGHASVTMTETSRLINPDKGSALAALRAFFDLSPLWMKGAVGFAALLFCVFSVFTVAHLRNTPAAIATSTNSPGHSQQELNALVEKGVQVELARRKAAVEPAAPRASAAVKDGTVPARSRGVLNQRTEVAANARNEKARRPLSKAEREQLATDLRLVSSRNERSLDLVDDQINEQ
jgi:anti-sigma factor RsiW